MNDRCFRDRLMSDFDVIKQKYDSDLSNIFCELCGDIILSEKASGELVRGRSIKTLSCKCTIKPKKIGEQLYFRRRCDHCFEKQFGRFPNGLNIINYDMVYLFNVPEDVVRNALKNKAVTLDNMIRKHGEKLGKHKFETYKRKQAKSNTFEYKKKKHGWTKKKFDEFNKSRAITLNNMIKRHGKALGTEKFKEYCEQQRYTCTLEYYIDKYGEKKGRTAYDTMVRKKALTRDNFIRKYGEVLGKDKFDEFWKKRINDNPYYSVVSQELFDGLIAVCPSLLSDKIYYATRNCEYSVYNKRTNKITCLDFYHLPQNKAIEFYGNYWHLNPEFYDADYFHPILNMHSLDVWKRDKKRIDMLREDYGIEVLVVWESEYTATDKEMAIHRCLDFLNLK